jgi:tetratricopeptide (TPR) repeat protein
VTAGARSCAVILAVGLAASVTSLRNGFAYDDLPAVRDDARIRSLETVPRLLASPYWNNQTRDRLYRPFTTVSFAVDWAIGKGSPLPFHATNILLNLAVCALVFFLVRAVLGPGPGAAVAGLWFAVHPVHVEAVANIVGRSELLAALGYLGAVLAYGAEGRLATSSPRGGRRAAFAALALAGAALAYGSKEHALTLPAALLLADAWNASARGERWRRAFSAHGITWLGTVTLAVGYLAARHAVLGTTFGGGNVAAGLENLSRAGRAMVMAPALLEWARLLLIPLHLSVDYSPDAFVPFAAPTLSHVFGAALVAAAVVAAAMLRRRAPAITLGIAGFAVTAAVASNIVFPTGVLIAERVLYLPSVAAALLVGALWERLRGRVLWPVTAILLAALAMRTIARIPVWRDNTSFYDALLADAPDSYRAHWARGAHEFEQHRPHDGEAELLRAVRIYAGDTEMLQEIGQNYARAGLWAPADRWLTAAWRLDTLRADAAVYAVVARNRLGHYDSAAAIGEDALRHFPDAPTLLLATSDAWFALGKPMLALTYRRRMALAFPRTWQYQYEAADGAARAGRCEEARFRAARAAALAPLEAAPRTLLSRIGTGHTCRLP